jgi:radical SAM superfamily enzyme YgiQ (UPF0313 family)
MKVTLIYPSSRKSNPNLQWWKQPRSHRYPGLGWLIVASLCNPATDITLVDDEVEDIPYEKETDLVGISLFTANSYRAYEISKSFRCRGIPVILGGVHVVACPEEASEHADSIVVGEAEDTWPELLKDFNSGKLKRMYTSTNTSDLSNMPLPRRDLLDKTKYSTINTVQATRGCPFDCEFCSMRILFGSRTRCRPAEEVIEEIKSLDGNAFLLNDDNLAQKRDYYKNLFRSLIPLNKKWVGAASWNIANDNETLDLLEKSGCRALAVGFESLEPHYGVKKIGSKGDNFLRYKEVVKKLHTHKIAVLANFIFGFDNDNESMFKKTLEFALESQIDTAQFNILVPYPGTPVYQRLEEEGRITDRNWSNYISCNLCYKLKNMSKIAFLEELYKLKRKFYSSSKIAIRVMRTLKRATLYESGLILAVNLGYKKFNRKFQSLSS